MLNRIEIKNLFGLYTYDLTSLFSEEAPIRFITGPNGYGKSTILKILSRLFICDFEYFKSLCFDELLFSFDDYQLEVVKLNTSVHVEGEDISKNQSELAKSVKFSLKNATENISYVLSSESKDDVAKMRIEMFLSGESHYLIKDQRLYWHDAWDHEDKLISSSENTVNRNADCLRRKLLKCREEIRLILSIQSLSLDGASIGEEEYTCRKKEMIPVLDKLKRYGLANNGFILPEYREDASSLMRTFVEMAEHANKQSETLLKQVDLFKEIIEGSDFADKEFQISPDYGYRFVSHNSDRTLLDGSDLSSGEQHILIQAYELIFNAQEGALTLIDEPEMSFHLIWQMGYLKNLSKIVKQKRLQCLVATHSPQIFDSMWDLTYDLYELTHPKIVE